MKTDKEIREYKETLKTLLTDPAPCSCTTSGHSFECVVGGYMMKATHAALEWVLEEGFHEEMVSQLTEMAAMRLKGVKSATSK